MPKAKRPLSAVVEVERMQDARRAFTRRRICSAAREVFFAHGFAESSIEQIAQAAGSKRSSLYNHFRDKDEILQEIATEYGESLSRIISQLPGPVPSRRVIEQWLTEVANFTVEERTPTVLLAHLGHALEVPAALKILGETLMQAFASRLPAFRYALEPGPRQGLALARAMLVMRQIGAACLHRICETNAGHSKFTMAVAAEVFERFLHDESQDPSPSANPGRRTR